MIYVIENALIVLIFASVTLVGVYFALLKQPKEPEAKRKWTDPKFHN